MVAGATLGKYRILKQLGQGGMGVVYLAEHTLIGHRVAIKVLRPGDSADQHAVQRFFHEARALSDINDPGIVEVIDFGQSDGRAYLVMELLEGEPMEKRLAQQGRLAVGDALRFARQICTSLAAAHAKNIVHRDLKPENLFIVRDPAVVVGGERIKILDFGLAKRVGTAAAHALTRTGIAMGTPHYMSPEQWLGQGEIDQRCDIYAMGCVMFTMLTGAPPFTHEQPAKLSAAHLRDSPPLASSRVQELAGAVDEMLQRCLEKSPADRFASMAELVAAIDTACQASAQTVRVDPQNPGAPVAAPTMPDGYAVESAPVPTRPDHLALNGPLESRPAVSTLTEAAGQRTLPLPPPAPRRGRWLAVLAAVVVVTGGAVFLVWPRSGAPSMPMPAAAPAATVDATPVAVPAAPVPAPAAVIEDAQVAMGIDAGVTAPVAAPAVVEPRDAAQVPALAERPAAASTPAPPDWRKSSHKGARPPKPGGEHASSTGSAAPPIIDRGD